MNVNELKVHLKEQAIKKWGKITPCNGLTFDKCYRVVNDRIYFWFNDSNNSTHVLFKEYKH